MIPNPDDDFMAMMGLSPEELPLDDWDEPERPLPRRRERSESRSSQVPRQRRRLDHENQVNDAPTTNNGSKSRGAADATGGEGHGRGAMIRLGRGAQGVAGSSRRGQTANSGQAAGRGARAGGGGARGGQARGRAVARIPWECRTGTVVVAAPAWGLSRGPEIAEDDSLLEDSDHQDYFAPSQHRLGQDEEGDYSQEQPEEDEAEDHNNNMGPLRDGRRDPVPEKQHLTIRGDLTLTALATLAGQVVSGHERGRLVSELFDNLQGSNGQPSSSLMTQDSVENIALRCGQLEESIASMDFMYMLNVIQFRTKVIMCVSILSHFLN